MAVPTAFALLSQHPADSLDREVLLGEEDDLGDLVALPRDGLVMIAEITAETIDEGRPLALASRAIGGVRGARTTLRGSTGSGGCSSSIRRCAS